MQEKNIIFTFSERKSEFTIHFRRNYNYKKQGKTAKCDLYQAVDSIIRNDWTNKFSVVEKTQNAGYSLPFKTKSIKISNEKCIGITLTTVIQN